MRKVIIVGMVALAGCGGAVAQPPSILPTQGAPVQPAAATQVPGRTATLPSGQEARFEHVRLTLPEGLSTGIIGTAVPASSHGANDPYWAGWPAHTQVSLANYPFTDNLYQPSIRVYPAVTFALTNQEAARQINLLKRLLADRPAVPDDPLPMLPLVNASQALRAHVGYLDFHNVAGIRYITQYQQSLNPVSNNQLIYVYQGITADGQHYVSATLPINVHFLPQTMQSPLPEGGLPFPDINQEHFRDAYAVYVQGVTAQINATPAHGVAPGLESLDALVQSIRVE